MAICYCIIISFPNILLYYIRLYIYYNHVNYIITHLNIYYSLVIEHSHETWSIYRWFTY